MPHILNSFGTFYERIMPQKHDKIFPLYAQYKLRKKYLSLASFILLYLQAKTDIVALF